MGLAAAQGTAFSYQGQLTDGAAAANGTYDLTFSLWNAATDGAQQGATLTQAGVGVTNGLFTATLDFGAQFSGQNRWLEIAVRTNGAATFTTLAERQPVLPTPYAIHAATAGSATTATTVTGSVPASQLIGSLSAVQIPNLDASKITSGTFTGNGGGLSNIALGSLVQFNEPVVAWGRNDSGEATVPAGLDDCVSLAAGYAHSVALRSNGTVVVFGGQDAWISAVPSSATNVVAVSAGFVHTLALRADGVVIGWGTNHNGLLSLPADLTNATAVSAGLFHSLIARADGSVLALGGNDYGKCDVPADLTNAVAVAAGFGHSLALRRDGSVTAWGLNENGQTDVPSGLTNVTAIAAGFLHSLALTEDGTVLEWGLVSGKPASATNIVAIAAGGLQSLALRDDGVLIGWGWGPGVSSSATNVVAMATGGSHSLALRQVTSSVPALARLDRDNVFAGMVSAPQFQGGGGGLTGLNASELVSGTIPADRIPGLDAGKITSGTFTGNAAGLTNIWLESLVDVGLGVIAWGDDSAGQAGVPTGLSNVVSITAGEDHSIALKSDGTLVSWGRADHVPAGLNDVVAVAAGTYSTLLIRAGGRLVAAGNGAEHVPDVANAVAVSARELNNLVLRSDGTVLAWGGIAGSTAAVWSQLTSIAAISSGGMHGLALKSDGTVVAWGDAGILPDGLSGVTAISAGFDHSLALRSDGTVVAWGNDNTGEASVPPGLTGVVAISAGNDYSLALKSDGTVVAWGDNSYGRATVPLGVRGGTAIAAGGYHVLVLGTVPVPARLVRLNEDNAFTGSISAASLSGNGAGLTHLNASALSSGTVPVERIPGLDAGNVVSGVFAADRIPALPPSKISGILSAAQIPNLDASKITGGTFSGNGSGLTALNASELSSGTVPVARIPDLDAGKITSGTLAAARIPNLDASKVTTGTLDEVRLSANVARLNNSPAFTAATDVRVATFTGTRTGGHDESVVQVENTSTSGTASPALRVVGRGTAADGALSVSAEAGLIARFGNANVWVAQLDNAGSLSATSFLGNGAGLTSLNASAMSVGTVPVARIPDLDAGKITSGTLAAARIPNLDASKVTTGTFTSAQVPDLDAGKVTTGTLATAQIPNLDAGKITTGTLDGNRIPGLHTSWITTGTFPDARLSPNVALLNGSPAFTAATGARVASFTGTRTGDFNAAVVHMENTQTGPTAAPALRVIARGGDAHGALSVTASSGPIARFGNDLNWVATIHNNGNLALTGTLSQSSDRNVKAGFAPVDVDAVLAKVAGLPLTTWHYTNDAAATPHLGPMAQDFHAAFGLGGDDKTITTVDADGVALAAIQGLHHRTTALAAENAAIREELARQQTANADMRDELGDLRVLVLQLQQQLNANRP